MDSAAPYHTTSDGVRLRLHAWSPRGDPVAAMLVLHGVGEYGGRYAGLGTALAERGIRTVAFDQRGHGESGGYPGHVDRWGRYLADANEMCARLSNGGARVPLFVYGHSMGSLICLGMAIEAGAGGTVVGWIVSGAGIEPTGLAKPHLVAIARLLSRVTPRVSLNLGIPAEALSHDLGVVDAYRTDPLVRKKGTVRWGAEALDAIAEIKERAHEIGSPMLVLHGGADPLSQPAGSRWLADTVGGETTLHIYDGCLHEPHNDPAYADAAGDIGDWILAHVTTH